MRRFNFQALGRLKTGELNKTERAYSILLEAKRQAGQVLWWRFEALKLRLADKTFFTPDFVVLAHDGVVELHEVKGFMLEDANVKLKVAAEQFPFRFVLAKFKRGEWIVHEIGA